MDGEPQWAIYHCRQIPWNHSKSPGSACNHGHAADPINRHVDSARSAERDAIAEPKGETALQPVDIAAPSNDSEPIGGIRFGYLDFCTDWAARRWVILAGKTKNAILRAAQKMLCAEYRAEIYSLDPRQERL